MLLAIKMWAQPGFPSAKTMPCGGLSIFPHDAQHFVGFLAATKNQRRCGQDVFRMI